jgi:hypothetical protein
MHLVGYYKENVSALFVKPLVYKDKDCAVAWIPEDVFPKQIETNPSHPAY